MKTNFNELFMEIFEETKNSDDISVDEVVNKMLPLLKYSESPDYRYFERAFWKQRVTTMLNLNECFSYQKGHFVHIDIASENQLRKFIDKARRDIQGAEKRKLKAEAIVNQLLMAWDEDGNFIGLQNVVNL